MSRVIVTNLPEKITKEKLLEIFSEKGLVTDVQLKYTKSGKFRRFAFIGFKEEKSAEAAVQSLHKTFINASQIQIELCAGLGDPNKPRAWSKHAPDSKVNKKRPFEETIGEKATDEVKKKSKSKIKDPKVEELVKNHKDDEMFKEFIELHLPQDESILKLTETHVTEEEKAKQQDEKKKEADKSISDLDYLKTKTKRTEEDDKIEKIIKERKTERENVKKNNSEKSIKNIELFTVKLSGLPFKIKKSDIKQFLEPVKPYTIRRPVKLKGVAFCGFKTEAELKKALHKNRSFLSGKRIFMNVQTKQDKPRVGVEDRWKVQEERLKNEETVAESGRIFLRNLPFTATEEDVKQHFEKFGPLTEIILPIDKFTRKPKGFGIVTYLIPEHASKAYTELDGSIFQGRMLHLLPSLPAKAADNNNDEESGTNYKKKKAKDQKQNAGVTTNWNTYFIGENALAETMASTYDTNKESVLDDRKNGVAVRLALGETLVVAKMKEFLEDNEVRLEVLNNTTDCSRSNTVIIIKNLPFGTSYDDIRDKFQGFGELKKIVLPPNGAAALVEFIEPSEARQAFRRLAYSKFKHVPMYLEWAPKEIFKADHSNKKIESIKEQPSEEKSLLDNSTPKNEKEKAEEDDNDEEESEPQEGTTIFVKDLNFSTTAEALKEHFSKCGKIVSATIAQKKDPNNPGKNLSLGFGFVQFSKKESADKALKTMQFSKLDDHNVELKRSNRTTSSSASKTVRKTSDNKNKPSSKIMVRNVPFQATQKEIEDLFKVFGEIKAVRLPKKMVGTGSHRGFCFVEYQTKHDAKRAFKALSLSTHLFGRRLVLEWASTDDS